MKRGFDLPPPTTLAEERHRACLLVGQVRTHMAMLMFDTRQEGIERNSMNLANNELSEALRHVRMARANLARTESDKTPIVKEVRAER